MADIDDMRQAKVFLEKLARGIDPLTDRELPETDITNNVHISRCLFYVSGVLHRLIENADMPAKSTKKQKKSPFFLSPEEQALYPFANSLTATKIVQRLNDLANLETMQKLRLNSITTFLLRSGLLEEQVSDGQKTKIPTEAGRKLGISTSWRQSLSGPYMAVVYDREAQRYLLEHLEEIMALNALPPRENQGRPWKQEDDDWLAEQFRAGMAPREMAVQLKRTSSAIRARLQKLGLLHMPKPDMA